jgi:hypothetical protein
VLQHVASGGSIVPGRVASHRLQEGDVAGDRGGHASACGLIVDLAEITLSASFDTARIGDKAKCEGFFAPGWKSSLEAVGIGPVAIGDRVLIDGGWRKSSQLDLVMGSDLRIAE